MWGLRRRIDQFVMPRTLPSASFSWPVSAARGEDDNSDTGTILSQRAHSRGRELQAGFGIAYAWHFGALGMNVQQQVVDYRTLSGPSLVAFFKICELWRLSDHESRLLLGCCPTLTQFAVWRSRPYEAELDLHIIKRISYLLSIYKALPRYLQNRAVTKWLRLPAVEPVLNGQTPLDYLLTATSDDLRALLIIISA